MKKRGISLVLALLLAFSLLPFSAMAATAPTAEDLKTPPVISNLEIHDDGGNYVWLEVTVQTPANVLNAIDYFENHELGYNQAGYIGQIDLQYSIDGGEWQETMISVAGRYYEDADETPRWNGIHETYYLDELHVNSEVKARARYNGADAEGNPRYSDWSNMLTLNEKVDFTAHDWAQAELAEAAALGLIPDSLKGADLTKPITRAEFAAVSVRVYESLSGTKAEPVAVNPFTDTKDAEVLKAYNVGVTNGISATTFEPNTLLNREQAATMLSRVYKKVALDGWTLETDGSFNEQFKALFTAPAAFADDASISGWAKDSVYFMAANGIINGVGDNKFAPKATTPAEQAAGYAQATREAALLIATRMVKNLG
ncbi:MAG: S-layer homology domain-containing protein [Ruminococcaceae bacterium]|nr:S-layer homology domain-containing protein [Oscillospiraceae bacterium]